MSSRRWGVGVAVVLALVLVAGAAGWTLLQPRRGPDVEHRYPFGGFTLTLPSSWRVHTRESGVRPWNWIEADRPTRLGPSDAWLWLNRTTPSGRDPLETARRNAIADVRLRWGNVHVAIDHHSFAGHPALRLRYTHPLVEQLGSLPGSDVDDVRLLTESDGQVYELGISGWRRLPVDVHDLEHVLRLSRPRGTRTIGDETLGVHLAVPAAWNRSETPSRDLPDAVMAAASPSKPAAWLVLWRFDASVETTLSNSAGKAAREGTILRRARTVVAGAPATRIDFTRHIPKAVFTYSSTWIFTGPDGKAWQLLVTSVVDLTSAASTIADSVVFT